MSMLDDSDALAALGVVQRHLGPGFSADAIDAEMLEQVRRDVATGTVRLEFGQQLPVVRESFSARLADAWRQGAQDFTRSDMGRGLRVHVVGLESSDPRDIQGRIRRADTVDSVSIVDRSADGPTRWSWPLAVTALGGEVEDAVAEYGHQKLLRIAGDVGGATDLLIVDDPRALASLEGARLEAGFLLLFVDSRDELVGSLRSLLARCRAMGLVVRPHDLPTFLASFFDALAHDHSPDIAISHAVRDREDYLVCGDPGFLDRARASLASANLESAIEQAFRKEEIDEAGFRHALEAIRAAPPAHPQLWVHEGMAASDDVDATEPARDILARRGTPKGAADDSTAGATRYLQGQVEAQQAGNWARRTRSFEPGATHRLTVRVGPSDLDWVQVGTPFPMKVVPQDGVRLTVTLLAPALLERPVQQEIYLRETGASTVATFEIDVPRDVTSVKATIIVQHKGKLLQSALLEGDVAPGDVAPKAIRFDRAPSQADLAHQRATNLTIWKDGADLLFTIYDPSAPEDAPSNREFKPSLKGIDKVVDAMRERLFSAAGKFDSLDGTIEDDGLETIRYLAEKGEYLRRTLFADPPTDIRRVLFASPYSSDSFPIEFLYDYELPDQDAALCPGFKRTPGVGCEPCSARDGGRRFVCPSGFWGLNRSIERQVRPVDASCIQPESSDANPGPLEMNGLVFAASDEVNAGDATRVEKTVQALKKIAPVLTASHWASWRDCVRKQHPCLLIALPHNVEDSDWQKLRIAAKEDLAFNRIRREYVAPENAAMGSPVLLFACNSANAEVEYEDFVKQLRCAGAPFVVATITYVLGAQAARVALEFTRQFWTNRGKATLGEILVRVRNAMLKQDNLMSLALVAYGDADWRI